MYDVILIIVTTFVAMIANISTLFIRITIVYKCIIGYRFFLNNEIST